MFWIQVDVSARAAQVDRFVTRDIWVALKELFTKDESCRPRNADPPTKRPTYLRSVVRLSTGSDQGHTERGITLPVEKRPFIEVCHEMMDETICLTYALNTL
jgi:hypothetical protein